MSKARYIWEQTYGPIPLDEDGRTYEIHHIDGNNSNNEIDNLKCISIKDHYNIHYEQGDYGACVLIAKRIGLPREYTSTIQRGKKRPGIGGVKKGTIPWNKGKNGYKLNLSENGKKIKTAALKERSKLSRTDLHKIQSDYVSKVNIDDKRINKVQKNGRIFSYDRAFCLHYSKLYPVSDQRISQIIRCLRKTPTT